MGTGQPACVMETQMVSGPAPNILKPLRSKNKNAWLEILCKVVFNDVSRQKERSPPPLPSLKTVGREEDKGNLKFKNTIDPLLCL